MKYLLDTNICIFFLRGKYGVPEKLCTVGMENCCISEITRAELLVGMYLLVLKRDKYSDERLLSFLNAIKTIPVTSSIDHYAAEKARLINSGAIIDDFDLLIGSTAATCGLTIVTDNVSHFGRLDGLCIENWISRPKNLF